MLPRAAEGSKAQDAFSLGARTGVSVLRPRTSLRGVSQQLRASSGGASPGCSSRGTSTGLGVPVALPSAPLGLWSASKVTWLSSLGDWTGLSSSEKCPELYVSSKSTADSGGASIVCSRCCTRELRGVSSRCCTRDALGLLPPVPSQASPPSSRGARRGLSVSLEDPAPRGDPPQALASSEGALLGRSSRRSVAVLELLALLCGAPPPPGRSSCGARTVPSVSPEGPALRGVPPRSTASSGGASVGRSKFGMRGAADELELPPPPPPPLIASVWPNASSGGASPGLSVFRERTAL